MGLSGGGPIRGGLLEGEILYFYNDENIIFPFITGKSIAIGLSRFNVQSMNILK